MFTFSADGQYIFTHQNGLIKKYDFSTGQLVESLTVGGRYIWNSSQENILFFLVEVNTLDEQGTYVGQVTFPEDIWSY